MSLYNVFGLQMYVGKGHDEEKRQKRHSHFSLFLILLFLFQSFVYDMRSHYTIFNMYINNRIDSLQSLLIILNVIGLMNAIISTMLKAFSSTCFIKIQLISRSSLKFSSKLTGVNTRPSDSSGGKQLNLNGTC
jgi:hypothetical protein